MPVAAQTVFAKTICDLLPLRAHVRDLEEIVNLFQMNPTVDLALQDGERYVANAQHEVVKLTQGEGRPNCCFARSRSSTSLSSPIMYEQACPGEAM
jgi:hypothetical protein